MVNASTGEVETYEALIRWNSPSRGLVSPALFIPVAEETGIITEIGAWVIEVGISLTCCPLNRQQLRSVMLIVETNARMRREHFVKGKTIKEIARDLKVSQNTVRKVLRSRETSFDYERVVQPRPKLGRWATELDGLLARNAAKTSREQLTLILRRTGRARL